MSGKTYWIFDYGSPNWFDNDVLNEHLQAYSLLFDIDYSRSGGVVGSPTHQMDKEEFMSSTARFLIEEMQKGSNDLINQTDISTCMKFSSKHLIHDLEIPVATIFDYDGNSKIYDLRIKRVYSMDEFAQIPLHLKKDYDFHSSRYLKTFDKKYLKAGGKIGSSQHNYRRMQAIKDLAFSVMNDLKEKDLDCLDTVSTQSTFFWPELDHEIQIELTTDFISKYPTVQDYIWDELNLN